MTAAGNDIVEPVPMPDVGSRDGCGLRRRAPCRARCSSSGSATAPTRRRWDAGRRRDGTSDDRPGEARESFLERWSRRKIEAERERGRRRRCRRSASAGCAGRRRGASICKPGTCKRCAAAEYSKCQDADRADSKPKFDLASLPSLEFDHRRDRHPRLPFAGRAGGIDPCGASTRVGGRSRHPRLQGSRGKRLGLHRSECDARVWRPSCRTSTSRRCVAQIFGEPDEAGRAEAAEPEPTSRFVDATARSAEENRFRQPMPSRRKPMPKRARKRAGPEAAASRQPRRRILCIAIVMLRRTIVFRPPRKMSQDSPHPRPALASVESSTHSLGLLTRSLVGGYLYIAIIIKKKEAKPGCGIQASSKRCAPLAASANLRAKSASHSRRYRTGPGFPPNACSLSRQRPASIGKSCGPISTAKTTRSRATSTKSSAARAQEYALLAALLVRAPDAATPGEACEAARRCDAARRRSCRAGASRERNHGRARRARILRSVHRARPRRTAALRLVLSHRLPARAPAGAAAQRPRAARHRARRRQQRAGRSRRDAVRDHGGPGRRPPAGAARAPISRSSRSIWRPGSAGSSPIWSGPKPPSCIDA